MSDAERTKWDTRYREQDAPSREPSPFLVSLDPILPHTGRALDVAGGAGRHAVWLAQRGLDVTIADISRVGLDLAEEEAGRAGVRLTSVALDLERAPLPAGPWDVIVSFHYLHRPLFAAYPHLLSPGGLLLVVHPTRSNLLRHHKPGGEFLLEDGELPGLVPGLTVVRYEEGWFDEGRHEARLVARRAME
jgi:SAM-dependent methyltransferase